MISSCRTIFWFYIDMCGLINIITGKKVFPLILFGVKKYPKNAGRGNCSLAGVAPLWDVNSNGP